MVSRASEREKKDAIKAEKVPICQTLLFPSAILFSSPSSIFRSDLVVKTTLPSLHPIFPLDLSSQRECRGKVFLLKNLSPSRRPHFERTCVRRVTWLLSRI